MQNNIVKHEPYVGGSGNFWNDFFGLSDFNEAYHGSLMRTDITEHADHYEFEVDVPSFKKNELSIKFEDGYLTISAKKDKTEEKKAGNYLRKERGYDSYSRSFYLGEDVDEKNITAKLNEGVLNIVIKKAEPKKPLEHNIEIQ